MSEPTATPEPQQPAQPNPQQPAQPNGQYPANAQYPAQPIGQPYPQPHQQQPVWPSQQPSGRAYPQQPYAQTYPQPGMPTVQPKPRRRWLIPVIVAGALALALVGALVIVPALLFPMFSSAKSDAVAAATHSAAGKPAASKPAAAPSSAPAPKPAAGKAPALFVAAEDGFSAAFPSTPKKGELPAVAGAPAGMASYVAGDGIQTYTVIAVPLDCKPPEDGMAEGLQQFISQAMAGTGKTLGAAPVPLAATGRDLDGHPGQQQDFSVPVGKLTIKGRYVAAVAGHHIYTIALTSPNPDVAAWDAFINSFKSLDPESTAAACQ